MDHFPRGSIIRRVSLEPAILFGAGRALLLQLAHPAVAQGVEDHSDFKGNPFKRLVGTLEAMYAAVFGSTDLARGVGARIQWIHGFVTGPGYAANDPANLLWVHATLLDTALRCYTILVEPLTPADEEAYYQQMAQVVVLFGLARDDQPPTLAAFRDYMDGQVARLELSPQGLELSRFILDPELPFALHHALRPALSLQRRFTLGTIPGRLREQIGAPWSDLDQARFERTQERVRRAFAATPRPLRVAPTALGVQGFVRLASHHVRKWEQRTPGRTGGSPTRGVVG